MPTTGGLMLIMGPDQNFSAPNNANPMWMQDLFMKGMGPLMPKVAELIITSEHALS